MTRTRTVALGVGIAVAALLAPSLAQGKPLPPRTGGKVLTAWPQTHVGSRGKPPRRALARWLARQVGPARAVTPKRKRARTAVTTALALVRSFDIPTGDPAYARLLNLSFTYDSAIGAIAFMAADNRGQAQQLLDQLAALQRTDGSLELAYDTSTGVGTKQFRTGTMAWVGLAAATFRSQYGSSRYDGLAYAAARWLLAQQTDTGLLRGGPDVTWVSTQNNIVATQLFARLGTAATRAGGSASPQLECVSKRADGTYLALFGSDSSAIVATTVARNVLTNRLSTGDGAQPVRFAPGRQVGTFTVPFASSVTWTLNGQSATATTKSKDCGTAPVAAPPPEGPTAAELVTQAKSVGDAIVSRLLVGDHFVQGLGDTVQPTDVQALGALLLAQRLDLRAGTVLRRMVLDDRITGRSVVKSTDRATYNDTYAAKGPFVGFRPYADKDGPDVLWFEWTVQARIALDALSLGDPALNASMDAWMAITAKAGEGPLGADKTVDNPRFNEFHAWPTSAAGSWALIQQTEPVIVFSG